MAFTLYLHDKFYTILKKNIQLVIRMSACVLMLTLSSMPGAWAQKKLKGAQENSVWAPAHVKVDGHLNEWPDTLQGYNKATALFYTIANDENNLYVVMKSVNRMNSSKIIGGGIDFTINTTDKKKKKQAGDFVIKYPIVDMANLQGMIMQRMRPQNGPPQPLDSAAAADIRRQLISSIKEIGLEGFKDIPDSSISIYNDYQIKAAIDIDSKNTLAIEMAIPLKYLHISANTTLFYNIKLKGLQLNFPNGMPQPPRGFQGGNGGFPGGGRGNFGGGGGGMPRSMGDIAAILSPTDFSGKYTLAANK
jgi:hypothetical protein